ncbi:MAG: hypothetical protein K9H64_14605 [Bacteroidales bacterium]|nr:hypothetical protein [Bacteroidales bacterium]MCF8457194.1 hypothetical protein [Bacteroidales bacterium]
MKQAILTLAIILLPLLAFLQETDGAPYQLSDTNYIDIPGTRISLFPPKDFVQATKFAGLKEVRSGATIMVAEMDKPFKAIQQGFTKEGFASQGMDLLKSSEEYIGNEKALLYKASKKSGDVLFSKWILVFGDDTSSVMISGTFPDGFDSEVSSQIENCLLSAKFISSKNISAEGALGFKINTDGTQLKFAKSFPGTLVYTLDGLFPTHHKEGVSFKIGSSLGKVEIENPRTYALERLKSLPYTFKDDPQFLDAKIDDLSGYEIIAYGKDETTGLKVLVYQAILYSHSSYYIMQGLAVDNFESNLSLFIDIASTFARVKR